MLFARVKMLISRLRLVLSHRYDLQLVASRMCRLAISVDMITATLEKKISPSLDPEKSYAEALRRIFTNKRDPKTKMNQKKKPFP